LFSGLSIKAFRAARLGNLMVAIASCSWMIAFPVSSSSPKASIEAAFEAGELNCWSFGKHQLKAGNASTYDIVVCSSVFSENRDSFGYMFQIFSFEFLVRETILAGYEESTMCYVGVNHFRCKR
jgi:hypothetical protein